MFELLVIIAVKIKTQNASLHIMLKLHGLRHFQRLVQNLKDTTSVSACADVSSILLIAGPMQFTRRLKLFGVSNIALAHGRGADYLLLGNA